MLGAADLSGEIAARGKLMRLPGVSLGPDYYLTDVFRGRVEYPDLRRKVVELAARHRSGTILIEEAGAGLGLVQDLPRTSRPG
jgi:phage terminase large subunit-like protein